MWHMSWRGHLYNEIGGACDHMMESTVVYRVLTGKPEGKVPLGSPGLR